MFGLEVNKNARNVTFFTVKKFEISFLRKLTLFNHGGTSYFQVHVPPLSNLLHYVLSSFGEEKSISYDFSIVSKEIDIKTPSVIFTNHKSSCSMTSSTPSTLAEKSASLFSPSFIIHPIKITGSI